MIADLTKMLQSAAKGKAPVVAIPIEGHAPACLNRKRGMALKAKLESIYPESIPNPRYAGREDMRWTDIDPIGRPKQDKREYYQHTYDRAALAERLREARQTIKVLTPPPDDNVLEMPEAEEFARAA